MSKVTVMMPQFKMDADIATAQTLDTAFYNDAGCYEQAKEKIFAASWQLLGGAELLQDVNVYPTLLLPGVLDEPVLLTKNDGNIMCLSNVCTHRGNIIIQEPGKCAHLRCGYHGRIFGLDGTMVSMPEFKEVKNFPCQADNLPRLPVANWGQFIFTNVGGHNNPMQFLDEMTDRLSWYPVNDLKYDASSSRDYHVKAHWALYCENYLEGFHIPFVHGGLNQELDFGAYTTELFRYSNLQLGIGKSGDDCFDLPSSSADHGKNVAAYYFWVFPNMMFNFYPWGLSVNIVKPTGQDSCTVSFRSYVLDERRLGRGAGAGLDAVELEDEAVVERVQQGVRSRFYKHGRYSVTREQGVHHFHMLLAEFMNR